MLPARKIFILFITLFALIVTTVLCLITPRPIFAKNSWADASAEDFINCYDKAKKDDSICGNIYGGYWMPANTMYGISKMSVGFPCSKDPNQQEQCIQTSAMGVTTQYIASIYGNPVASTYTYLTDLGERIGVPRSYAQGIGFGGLKPLLGLWRAFRDVAYIFMIVVLFAIGIMVMFRMKIDPHTVISIQAALPKIVITLILVTFSYAIAGFLIDLMYLVILLLISIIYSGSQGVLSGIKVEDLQAQYLTGGMSTLFSSTFAIIPQSLLNDLKYWLIGGAIGGGLSLILAPLAIGPIVIGKLLPGLLAGGIAGSGASTILGSSFGGAFFSPLIYFLIALGLLFMFVRLLFMLINAYVQVIISVIFGPFQIMFDALPTNGGGFGNWIRNLIANLSVFPTVVAMLLVGRVISNTIGNTSNAPSPLWSPPLIPAWTAGAAQFVVGFGMITLIPTIVGGLKEILKAKPALPVGIGAPLAPFMGGVQTGLGIGQQFYYGQHLLKSTIGKLPIGKQPEQPA